MTDEQKEFNAKMITNGVRKLNNEMDISKMVKKVRSSYLLHSMLLSQK